MDRKRFAYIILIVSGIFSVRLIWNAYCGDVVRAATGVIVTQRDQLIRDVDELLKGDEIRLRKNIGKVFQLAFAYEEEGEELRAIKLYESALRVNSANLMYQLRFANLLVKHGRKDEATVIAQSVYTLAEDESLTRQAGDLLKSNGKNILEEESEAKIDSKVKIVLVPLGSPSPIVVAAVKKLLEQKMGIHFPLYDQTKGLGEFDRTFAFIFVRDYINWLQDRMSQEQFLKLKEELGFRGRDLDSYGIRKEFIYVLFDKSGVNGKDSRLAFEKGLAEADRHLQYDLFRLRKEMAKEFPLCRNSEIKGYLAITNEDLFEGDSRYLFGGATPGYGVFSYHRFTSRFNNEDQNRPRLIKRTLKQALSSANFVLGIPRCTTPDCARAYPNSLTELDQKSDELCPICKERLFQYIKAQNAVLNK